MSTPAADQTRINTYISTTTARLITDHAEEWGCTKGEAVDRLIGMAVGIESTQRRVAEDLDVMEEMVRRVLGDFTLQTTNTLRQMLDERLAQPHVEASTARLLLVALISYMKSPEVAIKNEDEALRVARRGREAGEIPLLMRSKKA